MRNLTINALTQMREYLWKQKPTTGIYVSGEKLKRLGLTTEEAQLILGGKLRYADLSRSQKIRFGLERKRMIR